MLLHNKLSKWSRDKLWVLIVSIPNSRSVVESRHADLLKCEEGRKRGALRNQSSESSTTLWLSLSWTVGRLGWRGWPPHVCFMFFSRASLRDSLVCLCVR